MNNHEFLEYLKVTGIFELSNDIARLVVIKSKVNAAKLYNRLSSIRKDSSINICLVQLICLNELEELEIKSIISLLKLLNTLFEFTSTEWKLEVKNIIECMFYKGVDINKEVEERINKINKSIRFVALNGDAYRIVDNKFYKFKDIKKVYRTVRKLTVFYFAQIYINNSILKLKKSIQY